MASSAKSKEKGFQTSLRTLETATKDILSYTKALASADDLLAQNKHLQQKLDAANVTIQEQQSKLCAEEKTNKDLKETFNQMAKDWANENKDLHAQIKNASIESTNAVKKKENELNKLLEAAEQATRQARKDLEKQNLRVLRLDTSLEETSLQLRGLQADAGVEELEGRA
ncbi:hypothetical protein N8T08_011186 [Aspergillus melleus]|uniref:Uncharacterized protein n=1 Tax=Aspergillus melleus TaxID=138277 RepID=A0ACC3AQC2_9EURO|nr:hypothetical protein N8T08_011186 [Aspergillus melleus]